jgi:lipopolysaccharide transport system ATP-binding protein
MDSSLAIEATNLSKKYRLGTIGMSSLREDLSRWWKREDTCELAVKKESTAGIEQSRMINDSEFWALHDLYFKIPKGEVVGLIGANGSGKSTLLKILSRITEPTHGEVKIRGKVASLLEVGTGFHPELTGQENVYINGTILGMTRKEVDKKFDEIVDFAGVADFIETPIKRYSSGMTVRLGFAVAAHLDPDILIVDEVLAVGDASFQKKCLGKMEDISSQGRTIIFVSHQMPMIESLCSQSFWMQKGKINSCGITKDIVQSYLSSIYEFKENTLKNWLQRKGTGEITLANIVVRSKKLKLNDTVRIGDSAYFCFQFVCKNKSLCHNKTSFRFAINNEQNQRISTIDSRSTNLVIKHASEFKLKIKIEKINFPEGKYFITSFIGYDENAYDWIINAHSFEVISGDFFGNGRYQNIPTGEILLDHKMEVNYS